MGSPLVMKLLSPDISHKTEAGGVRLDLCSDGDARATFAGIVAFGRRYKASTAMPPAWEKRIDQADQLAPPIGK